jgi:hypothetical protein
MTMSGIDPASLSEDDLVRELAALHRTRHETFLHGSAAALLTHTERLFALEAAYMRRHPRRQTDPERLRDGARERGVPMTGS